MASACCRKVICNDSVNFLDFLFRVFIFTGNFNHVSLSLPVARAERNLYAHSNGQLLLQRVRDPVLKRSIYFFMGNVNNDICIGSMIHALFLFCKLCCSCSLPSQVPFIYFPARISRIRSLSSIGYFTPLIS